MTTPMKGPVLDTNPPTGGTWETTNIKWKFKNETGEKISDLRVVVNGAWYQILPDIREIEVKDAAGSTVGKSDFNDVHDAHLVFTKAVEKDAEFTVEVKFDSSFDAGESVQFSPTDENRTHIVASVAPIDPNYLAYATALIPPVARDVLFLGGAIPIPVTSPLTALTVFRVLRWLVRMLPAYLAIGVLPAGRTLDELAAKIVGEFEGQYVSDSVLKQRARDLFAKQIKKQGRQDNRRK